MKINENTETNNCTFRTKNLTSDERNRIVQALLQQCKNKKLYRGVINSVAKEFKLNRKLVSRIWKTAKEQLNSGNSSIKVISNKKDKCGRKKKDYSENLQAMKKVPFNRRGTIRSLACAIEVPKSTLHDRLKEGTIFKRITSAVKPL